MFLTISGFFMPLLLVFGLYHLFTWFNTFRLNSQAFWKRLAVVSAVSHIILAVGFFLFSYADYRLNESTTMVGLGFDSYLFNQSQFWRLMLVFDTSAMLTLLGILAVLDRLQVNPPFLVAGALGVTLVVGTLQWYLVGGGVGLLMAKFWDGFKSADDRDGEWF